MQSGLRCIGAIYSEGASAPQPMSLTRILSFPGFYQFMTAGHFDAAYELPALPGADNPFTPWHFLLCLRRNHTINQPGLIPRAGFSREDLAVATEMILIVLEMMTDHIPIDAPHSNGFSLFQQCSLLGGLLAKFKQHIAHGNFLLEWHAIDDPTWQMLMAQIWNHICHLFLIFQQWKEGHLS